MFIGISNVISGIRTAGLSYIKDNLKLYLDFKSNRSDTLAFPSEGSTSYSASTQTYIDFGDNDTLDMGTSSFTLAGWIKLNADSGTSKMMFGKTQNASGAKWAFGVSGSEKAFISISDGSTSADETGATTISIGQWVHVVGVYDTDADTLSVFLNGVQDATMSASGVGSLSNSLNLRSGRGAEYPFNYNNNFQVANIAIWKRPLALEEINSVMNKSYSQLGSVEKTSLVSWWALDSQSNGLVQPATGETLSSNYVTNSTFDSDISGWSQSNSDSERTISHATVDGRTCIDINDASTSNRFNAQFDLGSNAIDGELYKISYYVRKAQTGSTSKDFIVGLGFSNVGGDAGNVDKTVAEYDTWEFQEIYIICGSANNHLQFLPTAYDNAHIGRLFLDDVKVQKVTSNTGVVTGATTTTSVYGGNAPILPRAIDIAESQAEQIGNGSAYFVKSNTDYIQANNHNLLVNGNATMACWAKATAISQEQFFGGHHNSKRFYFGISSANKPFFGVQDQISSDGDVLNISANEWNHYALVANGGTATFYFNGINVHTMSYTQASGSNPNNLFVIGARNDGGAGAVNVASSWDGYIGQYGLWQGALTQAQIQSLMESTSYAKIPADVKSTKTETVLRDFSGVAHGSDPTDLSYIYAYGSPGEKVIDNERLKIVNSSNTGVYWKEDGLTSSKLYKITIDATGDVATDGVYSGTISFTLSNGTFTAYKTGITTTGVIYLRANNNSSGTTYYDNLKVEEVTNELVAYYPLDADNSRGNGTDDVVTGETLGSELLTSYDFTDTSQWNQVSNVTRTSATSITATSDNGTIRTTNASFEGTTKLYKINIQGSVTTGNITLKTWGGQETYKTGITGTFNENVYAFTSYGGLQILLTANTAVATITSLSIKEVTSNTGVLK